MNITSKIVIAAAVSILFAQVALALSFTNKPGDYSIIVLKNCEVVSNKAMTDEQLEAYLSLKQQEQKIHVLEVSIQDIEQEILSYTKKMEKLTELAIQETDEILHINKARLKQRDIVANEFDKFMQLHQQDFEVLGKQGNVIGQQAEIFETSIKVGLESVDYDQIQVHSPDSNQTQHSCDNASREVLM